MDEIYGSREIVGTPGLRLFVFIENIYNVFHKRVATKNVTDLEWGAVTYLFCASCFA
jgi:hypothetical protein